MDKGIEALIAGIKSAAKESKELSSIARYKKGADAKNKFCTLATEENVLKLIAALEQEEAYRKSAFVTANLWRDKFVAAEQRIEQLEAAPSGMMQLSNELAEMKRKCAELEAQFDELSAQEPVAYITERNLKLLKNGLHDCFVKHKPIMVRPIPLFTRAAPLTAKQPTPATTFDAAAAIRACMDEFPLAVQDIVEECAVIAENTIRAAVGTVEGSE